MLQQTKCPNCDHEDAIHFTAIGIISCGACGYREERYLLGCPSVEVGEPNPRLTEQKLKDK